MPDPVGTSFREHIDRLLDVQSTSVNKIAHDEITSTIETVMTVNSNNILPPSFLFSSCLLICSYSVDLGKN
jgi:hypothetical protein